jgi:hypothetical protein
LACASDLAVLGPADVKCLRQLDTENGKMKRRASQHSGVARSTLTYQPVLDERDAPCWKR